MALAVGSGSVLDSVGNLTVSLSRCRSFGSGGLASRKDRLIMGDLGKNSKFWFYSSSPDQQKRVIARDTAGEARWIRDISRLAIENANNLGKDRDSELKDILDEDLL